MILFDAIESANQGGRKGLIVYGVPGYPDLESWARIRNMLDEREAVSIVETTVPVAEGFSSHANETIRRAHTIASRLMSGDAWLRDPRPRKPTLLVLYEETVRARGFDAFVDASRHLYEGIVLEWDEPDDDGSYARRGAGRGVELIQCIGPWMTEARIAELTSRAQPNGLIYLMSAPMTGAQLFGADQLEACIASARRARADVKIAAGFGIRTAADVRSLGSVAGLDAVIVGTAFLEACGTGADEAERFIAGLEEAL